MDIALQNVILFFNEPLGQIKESLTKEWNLKIDKQINTIPKRKRAISPNGETGCPHQVDNLPVENRIIGIIIKKMPKRK